MERSIFALHFRCECVERRRVLYRGLWSKVCCYLLYSKIILSFHSRFHDRFERELEELRKELAEATAARPASERTSPTHSDVDGSLNGSPDITGVEASPQPELLSLDSTSNQTLLFTSNSTNMDTKKEQ